MINDIIWYYLSGIDLDHRLAKLMHRHCVFSDDISHLLDFFVEVFDVLVVFFDRRFSFVVLLLKHFFLRSHTL